MLNIIKVECSQSAILGRFEVWDGIVASADGWQFAVFANSVQPDEASAVGGDGVGTCDQEIRRRHRGFGGLWAAIVHYAEGVDDIEF